MLNCTNMLHFHTPGEILKQTRSRSIHAIGIKFDNVFMFCLFPLYLAS